MSKVWLRAALVGLTVFSLSCGPTRDDPLTLEWWFPDRDVQSVRFLQQQKISFFVQDLPLSDTLQLMHKKTGLHFAKHDSLANDPLVTFRSHELPVFVALNWLCGTIDSGWGVKGNIVYIGDDLDDMDFKGILYRNGSQQ
jgi:hypothetical protein